VSKPSVGFVFAGILVVAGFLLAMWSEFRQPDQPPTATASLSHDEAAKAASRAMTFTPPKAPNK
jgi:hypothetical protein